MKPHLLTEYPGPPSRCDFGITEAIAAIGLDLAATGAVDAGATAGLSAVGAGAADAAAGISLADLGAGVGAAGLGAADVAGGFGEVGADLGAAGSPLGFAGTSGAAAANPLADLSAAGLTAPGVGGAAPAAAGPVDLASSFSAASDSLNPLNWTGFSLTDPATGVTTGGTFSDAGIAGSEAGATPLSSSGLDAGAASAHAAGGSVDLASLSAPSTGGGLSSSGGGLSSVGAGAGAGGNAVTTGGSGNILDSLVTGATNQITKNPLGLAAGVAGLGYNIFEGQKTSANEKALEASAASQAASGAQLQNYLNTGTLPPGVQAQVDQATAAAKARIISGYASRGQNADPAQNSALAQELAGVDTSAIALQGQLATNLLNSGIQETGMSNNLYQALIQIDQTQATNMGKAIANFAGALAPRTSINIGGGSSA